MNRIPPLLMLLALAALPACAAKPTPTANSAAASPEPADESESIDLSWPKLQMEEAMRQALIDALHQQQSTIIPPLTTDLPAEWSEQFRRQLEQQLRITLEQHQSETSPESR